MPRSAASNCRFNLCSSIFVLWIIDCTGNLPVPLCLSFEFDTFHETTCGPQRDVWKVRLCFMQELHSTNARPHTILHHLLHDWEMRDKTAAIALQFYFISFEEFSNGSRKTFERFPSTKWVSLRRSSSLENNHFRVRLFEQNFIVSVEREAETFFGQFPFCIYHKVIWINWARSSVLCSDQQLSKHLRALLCA